MSRCSKEFSYTSEDDAKEGLRTKNRARLKSENARLLTNVYECPHHNEPTWHLTSTIKVVTGGRRKRR